MNPEAVLPDSKEEAKSLKEIALAMGLETLLILIGLERSLARVLRTLIKWGWVARDKR